MKSESATTIRLIRKRTGHVVSAPVSATFVEVEIFTTMPQLRQFLEDYNYNDLLQRRNRTIPKTSNIYSEELAISADLGNRLFARPKGFKLTEPVPGFENFRLDASCRESYSSNRPSLVIFCRRSTNDRYVVRLDLYATLHGEYRMRISVHNDYSITQQRRGLQETMQLLIRELLDYRKKREAP